MSNQTTEQTIPSLAGLRETPARAAFHMPVLDTSKRVFAHLNQSNYSRARKVSEHARVER